MPKKNKFPINITHKFRSSNKSAQDDSDDEHVPEHFKYGVYYTDDYDYMKHLVSMEDFQNPEFELPDLNSLEKDKPKYSAITQPQTMDEGVEELDEIFDDNDEVDGEEGEDFFGKLIEVEQTKSDESSDENTCTGAIAKPERKVTFGNGFTEKLDEIADEMFKDLVKNDEFSDDVDDEDEWSSMIPENLKQRLNELSQRSCGTAPLTEEDRENIRKYADFNETEYDSDEINREIDNWWQNRKVKFDVDPFNPPTKKQKSKNQPKKLKLDFSGIDEQIEKQKLQSGTYSIRMHTESITESADDSVEEGIRKQPTFVHRQRGKMETAEEKKERKREIKEARRNRRTEKKQNQKLYS